MSSGSGAKLALQAGVDVKVVSERLGHANKTTWDIYQHVTPTMQADAADIVARLIFGDAGSSSLVRDQSVTTRQRTADEATRRCR